MNEADKRQLEKRAQQLGMPFGTAQNRLMKSLLFQLVCEVGRDQCFKCGELIKSVGELSIEHKEPWLGNDPALFWDLNNIAFSHRRCNIPQTNVGAMQRKIGPAGTLWCSSCQAFLPEVQFCNCRTRYNGKHNRCTPCQVAQKRERRKKQRENRGAV